MVAGEQEGEPTMLLAKQGLLWFREGWTKLQGEERASNKRNQPLHKLNRELALPETTSGCQDGSVYEREKKFSTSRQQMSLSSSSHVHVYIACTCYASSRSRSAGIELAQEQVRKSSGAKRRASSVCLSVHLPLSLQIGQVGKQNEENNYNN